MTKELKFNDVIKEYESDNTNRWYLNEVFNDLIYTDVMPDDDIHVVTEFTLNNMTREIVYVMYPGIQLVGVISGEDDAYSANYTRLKDPLFMMPDQNTGQMNLVGMESMTGVVPANDNYIEISNALIYKPKSVPKSILQQYIRQLRITYEFRIKTPKEMHEMYLEEMKNREAMIQPVGRMSEEDERRSQIMQSNEINSNNPYGSTLTGSTVEGELVQAN